jgi:two-component sensor histidine kinase
MQDERPPVDFEPIRASGASASTDALLLAEIVHRVSNEFAAAAALLTLAGRRSAHPDAVNALEDAGQRLAVFGEVHRHLIRPPFRYLEDAAPGLRGLCGCLVRTRLEPAGVRLVFKEQSVWLTSDHCWRLRMIVSELVTNAAKHAFRDADGTVTVTLCPDREWASCSVADDGCGMPLAFRSNGLTIIQRLVADMDGDLAIHCLDPGTNITVRLPAM